MILTLILLTCRKWWTPNNARKWQMGFNSAFKGLIWLGLHDRPFRAAPDGAGHPAQGLRSLRMWTVWWNTRPLISSIILQGVKALIYVHSLWYILLDDPSRIPPSSTPRTHRGSRAHARTNTHNPLAVVLLLAYGSRVAIQMPLSRHMLKALKWSDADTAVSWKNRGLLLTEHIINPFKRWIKSHLPFARIIRSSPFSPR